MSKMTIMVQQLEHPTDVLGRIATIVTSDMNVMFLHLYVCLSHV